MAPSPGFLVFFKLVFIVICLGVVHAVVLLPCLLQFLVDMRIRLGRRGKHVEPAVLLSVSKISEEVVLKTKVNATHLQAYDNLGF